MYSKQYGFVSVVVAGVILVGLLAVASYVVFTSGDDKDLLAESNQSTASSKANLDESLADNNVSDSSRNDLFIKNDLASLVGFSAEFIANNNGVLPSQEQFSEMILPQLDGEVDYSITLNEPGINEIRYLIKTECSDDNSSIVVNDSARAFTVSTRLASGDLLCTSL